MPAIPPWALGRHVTAITIRAFSAAPDGTLTGVGVGAITITGIIDEIDLDEDAGAQNVPPVTSPHESMILVRQSDTYILTEILRSNTGLNILAAAYYATTGTTPNVVRCDYANVNITRAGKTFGFYGLMADYTESIRQGKNTGRLTLMQADVTGDATVGYL